MAKYTFNEDKILKNLKSYIDKTYEQHYASGKIQATEFVFDAEHGEGFCIGNIMKYAQRFGKKNGKQESDLYKVIHYAIILLGNMEDEKQKELREYEDELYKDKD